MCDIQTRHFEVDSPKVPNVANGTYILSRPIRPPLNKTAAVKLCHVMVLPYKNHMDYSIGVLSRVILGGLIVYAFA